TSSDAGKTWQLALPISVTAAGKTTTRPYLGFAGGPNGAILALTNNTGTSGEKPVSVWSSSDRAKAWTRLAGFPVVEATRATRTGQLFAVPGGQTIYGLVHASTTTSDAKSGLVTVARSTDGGTTWTAIPWPTGTDNSPLGGALIGQLGIDFAVDAKGDAFAAP